jgi:hypothetical protein
VKCFKRKLFFSTDDQAEEDKQPEQNEQPCENNLEQANDISVNDNPDDTQ